MGVGAISLSSLRALDREIYRLIDRAADPVGIVAGSEPAQHNGFVRRCSDHVAIRIDELEDHPLIAGMISEPRIER